MGTIVQRVSTAASTSQDRLCNLFVLLGRVRVTFRLVAVGNPERGTQPSATNTPGGGLAQSLSRSSGRVERRTGRTF
jgi:hypothetical protein